MSITVPYNFTPRPYQLPFLSAMDNGKKRAVAIWHRRGGKDKTFLNFIIKKMFERVGIYYYFFPTYAQGKKILWDGIDGNGFRFMDHFPAEIVVRDNSTDMKVEIKNGSIFQIIGTDKIDSIMGTNPVGCVFSEYSLQNPKAWDLIRPILRENGGWAVFNYTPRGKNHGYDLYQMAKDNPDWFYQVLTIKDTQKENGVPIITEADIEKERAEGMEEDLIQQEYYCSFTAAVTGAYYAKQVQKAEDEGRICSVPHDPHLSVDTWWDLGKDDSTVIWFSQRTGKEIRFIDYYENNGEGLPHYVKVLKEKSYTYDKHYLPHDVEVSDLSVDGKKTRKDILEGLGVKPIEVVPKLPVEDGIEDVRGILNRCWFDKEKCKDGLHALREYHKEFDEKKKVFKSYPCHDWSSHACIDGDSLVLTDKGSRAIKEISVGDKVWTPNGYSRVTASGATKKVYEITELKLSNGNILRCTPEHKILTQKGFVRVDALRYNDAILSGGEWQCTLSSLFSRVKNTGFRATITGEKIGGRAVLPLFTEPFGNILTEISQKGMKFITKIVTPLTTAYTILSVYQATSISGIMPLNGLNRGNSNPQPSMHYTRPLNGMALRKAVNGMANTENLLGKAVNGINALARTAGKHLTRLILRVPSGAIPTVKQKRCVSVKGGMLVYDLTVEKNACYQANGILVSNSDAFRYFAVGFSELVMKPVTVAPRPYVEHGWMGA